MKTNGFHSFPYPNAPDVARQPFFATEMAWLLDCIDVRTSHDLLAQTDGWDALFPAPPDCEEQAGEYARFIQAHSLVPAERLVLALALVPHLQPAILDLLRLEHNPAHLLLSPRTGLAMPTVATALYLLAGDSVPQRVEKGRIFAADHLFYRKSVFQLGEPEPHFPLSSAVLGLSKTYLDLFTLDKFDRPAFSQEFPAHLLTTELDWEDLLLNENTHKKLDEVRAYLAHEEVMRVKLGMGRHMKQGFRVLFHGPSGTGKSLAASLLGKNLDREVYRIDLSTVVSKYIGETSKNLNALFNTAEGKRWILFFDEGDALFGKRQDAAKADNPSAHYANQDTAYLLQRIENYRGLIVVASNFKQNIDDAFTRRFQASVHFDLPDQETALRVWQANLSEGLPLASDVNISQMTRQYALSQAAIVKVIQRAVLQSLIHKETIITRPILDRCFLDEAVNFKRL